MGLEGFFVDYNNGLRELVTSGQEARRSGEIDTALLYERLVRCYVETYIKVGRSFLPAVNDIALKQGDAEKSRLFWDLQSALNRWIKANETFLEQCKPNYYGLH